LPGFWQRSARLFRDIGKYRDVLSIIASIEQGMGLIRILTDRGTEYGAKPETHDYQLYLAINDIDHSQTKANHPQTNGICERFHKTILQEFYQVAFRRKYIAQSRNCRWIWMTGCTATIMTIPIRTRCVVAEHPCKH
jgi:transposase InsO family protein